MTSLAGHLIEHLLGGLLDREDGLCVDHFSSRAFGGPVFPTRTTGCHSVYRQLGDGCISSAFRSAVTVTMSASTVTRSRTPDSNSRAFNVKSGLSLAPRVKLIWIGQDRPATLTG